MIDRGRCEEAGATLAAGLGLGIFWGESLQSKKERADIAIGGLVPGLLVCLWGI